jgi:hypothetical protein
VIGAVGVLVPSVSAAQANVLGLGLCNSNALTQPFAQWGDYSAYELAPGGDFESSDFANSPWTLSGGAKLVAGSEPYAATGALGASSLSLPAGSSAQSSTTCVGTAYPTVRFFTAGTGIMAVSVVAGNLTIPAGLVVATGSWEPSPVLITLNPVFGLLSNGTAQVSLRFTALAGSPQVDDVFIDPWGRS